MRVPSFPPVVCAAKYQSTIYGTTYTVATAHVAYVCVFIRAHVVVVPSSARGYTAVIARERHSQLMAKVGHLVSFLLQASSSICPDL